MVSLSMLLSMHRGPLSLSVSGAAGVEAGTALQAVTPT